MELISTGCLRGHKFKRRLDKFLGDWCALQLLVISSLGTIRACGCIWTTVLSNPSLARGSPGNYLFFPLYIILQAIKTKNKKEIKKDFLPATDVLNVV